MEEGAPLFIFPRPPLNYTDWLFGFFFYLSLKEEVVEREQFSPLTQSLSKAMIETQSS